MSSVLANLPPELLLTLVLPFFNPHDLARLLQVNIRLNNLVHTYLQGIKVINLQRDREWNVDYKNCFKFMTSETTKLVRIRLDVAIASCISNKDLFRVIQRNPNLEKIDMTGVTISHRVLKQLLLCQKLNFLKFDMVGLWKTSSAEVHKDIGVIKKKVKQVFILDDCLNPEHFDNSLSQEQNILYSVWKFHGITWDD